MREQDLRDSMSFQLSLLRLVTAPHTGAEPVRAQAEGEKQLERLVQLAACGDRH